MGTLRTAREVIERAEEFAARFEEHEPDPVAIKDAASLSALREVARNQAAAKHNIFAAVAAALADGYSWETIGVMIGESGDEVCRSFMRWVTLLED